MGIYLNNTSAYSLYREDYLLTYFVDKTEILNELVPLLESKSKSSDASGKIPKYICITRPRRFGKSVMANMIAAYFGKGTDSSEVFDHLNVAKYPWYREHLNKHNVIHIYFNEVPALCNSYEEYITRISKILIRDLRNAYPQAEIEKGDTVWDALSSVYAYCGGEKFIFVLDEWDFIFHQSFATDADKTAFARFLNPLATDENGDPILTKKGEKIYYPVYQYYVAVNGISTDDPLVIEDTFDTSLFTLFDASKFYCVRKKNGKVYDGIDCYVQVEGYDVAQDDANERYPDHAWVNWLYPSFAGQNDIRNATPSETYGKAVRIYEDTVNGTAANSQQRRMLRGETNAQGYRVMESDHMKVEETATGARFTFKDMNFFKKDNGNYYPFYVVNYYYNVR